MPLQRSGQETLGGSQIAPSAEPKLDRVTVAVDGAVEIFPLASDFDVSLVNVPPSTDRSVAAVEPLQ
jgi:hypothetical protein